MKSLIQTNPKKLKPTCGDVVGFGKDLNTLVNRMRFLMKKYDGVGLAAPQINVPLRLFIWNVDKQFGVAANPTLELSGEEITYPEGCLSIPNKYFPLPRYNKAILTARNLEGEEFQIEAEGWLARCFQHEVDHLDKLLITDRIEQWIAGVAQEKQPLKKEDSVEEPSVI